MKTGSRVLVVDAKTNYGLCYGTLEYTTADGWVGVREADGKLYEWPNEAVCEAV